MGEAESRLNPNYTENRPFPIFGAQLPHCETKGIIDFPMLLFQEPLRPPVVELASELEPTPSNRGLCVTSPPTDWNPPLKKGAAHVVQAVSRLGSWLGAFVKKHGLFIKAIVCQLA